MTGDGEHLPRLIQGNHAYCAVCEKYLVYAEGVWRTVALRSARCTGDPARWRSR